MKENFNTEDYDIERIQYMIEHFIKKIEEDEENKIKVKDLQNKLYAYKKQLALKMKEKCIKRDENGIIITDRNMGPYKQKCDDGYIRDNVDGIAMVHCTDFFPKEHRILTNYDGNKEYKEDVTYDGITKECRFLAHRHTDHFTLNARVASTGDGMGNWDSEKYMIIEPLKKHIDQFVRINTSDAYTLGTVDLSDDAVILVREDAIDEIPKEEFERYKIIRFSGNPAICLENFLQLNGYNIFQNTGNDVNHYNSIYREVETCLEYRDMCINYIRDNTYLSREPIELSREEVFDMYNIIKSGRYKTIFNKLAKPFFDKVTEIEDESFGEIFAFYIASGLIPTGDGNFTFKSDEEILDIFKDMEGCAKSEDCEKILNNRGIKIEDIKQFYNEYCEREFEKLCADIDKDGFFEKHEDKKNPLEIMEEYIENRRKKENITSNLSKEEIKKTYEKNPKIYQEKEFENRRKRTLQKKMKDFHMNSESSMANNATEKEGIMKEKLLSELIDEINRKLQSRGINKYYFCTSAGVELALMRDDCNFEEINRDLDKKEHYIGMDEVAGVPTLDFKEKEDETVGEYLERLEKYTDCFSKYYDGETIDESIKFDENGDLIKEPKIERPDYEKTAKTKEAAIEIHSGKNVQEIKDEMNPNKTKEEVETEYGE